MSTGPQIALDPADVRAHARAALIDRWLPDIVDMVLASREVRDGMADAGLDHEGLRQQVLAAREQVIAPAEAQLERVTDEVVDADTSAGAAAERTPTPTDFPVLLAGLALGLALVVVASWTGWLWVAGSGTLMTLVCGGWLVAAALFRIYRGTPPTTSRSDAPLVEWLQACADEGVLPFVRRAINERLPLARTVLAVTTRDAPGLHNVRESPYMVQTSSVETFLAVAHRLPTGAIGLAGPRGVGKTSLIEHFANLPRGDWYQRPLPVTVSAPVQYEARDFVLHLFACVCHTVLTERGTDRPRPNWPSVLTRLRRLAGFGIATAAAAVPVLGVDVLDAVREPDVRLIPAGALAVAFLLELCVGAWHGGRWLGRRLTAGKEPGILGVARRHLENIHYLQTHTSSWSGKLPLKPEVGWSRSTQRERRPQTYPELVTALRDFLAAFARFEKTTPAMVIAVDELDKIEKADDAQRFVNEIKGIFGAAGTQFLVSVSEDALASFERRGLPVRDAFDSAFHEIVRVDYLTLADTANLLNSRVIGLPEPFMWLVHCMSGGLPRDVVRTARAMVALTGERPPSLDDVCTTLVRDDLTRKSHAFQLACRDIGDSPEVTTFIRNLRKLRADGLFLLALLPDLRVDGELSTISRQAAAYVYYSATLLEVFTRDQVELSDKDTFELLARARQSLAVHPRLAWLLVDEFREAWRLDTVPVD